MNEKEILEKGYKKTAGENLYLKNNGLFVQFRGSIREASKLSRDELQNVTSLVAYDTELKKLQDKEPKEKEASGKKKMEIVQPSAMSPTAMPMEIVAPQVDVEQAIEVFNKFTEFKLKLLSKEDYLYIGKDGKPCVKKPGTAEYIKKSGWRKFSTVFNLDCQILGKNREVYEDPGGLYYVWTYAVRVTAPNGRFQDAEGAATSRDPFFTKGGKQIPEEKNIMLKSQTVAFNRAISDLIGGGAKTAEEVE